jgi:hypothetical protein
MRCLAIARFRFLMTLRTATPIFVICVLPALVVAWILGSAPEPYFRYGADTLLGDNATYAFLAWIAHAIILSLACLASGNVKRPVDPADTTALPDLMDTTPVGAETRFWGEMLGTLGATSVIHVCCLPLLAAVAALSPLPTRLFATAEGTIVALMVLASTGAAWQRRAPQTRFSGTRTARSAIVFAILFISALLLSTRWEDFRDSAVVFLTRPSMQVWREVASAVENPLLLTILWSLLYAGYIYYYYASATRNTARA